MNETTASVNGNEIVMTRTVNAPRELVWKVWTEPEHVKNWWGPNGFTNTIKNMNVKKGGEWNFMMHGPDGTDYPNKILYTEVVKNELLSYYHSDPEGDPEHNFHVEVNFESVNNTTRITMKSRFSSAEAVQFLIKEVGAIEGGKQTLARCDAYLAETLIKQ